MNDLSIWSVWYGIKDTCSWQRSQNTIARSATARQDSYHLSGPPFVLMCVRVCMCASLCGLKVNQILFCCRQSQFLVHYQEIFSGTSDSNLYLQTVFNTLSKSLR